MEHIIYARLFAHRHILADRPGVALKILGWAELDWVYKYADYGNIILFTACTDEAGMAFMKRAHCGDQTYRSAGALGRESGCLHLFDSADDTHIYLIRFLRFAFTLTFTFLSFLIFLTFSITPGAISCNGRSTNSRSSILG
jgi:hypothetical protein